MSAKRQKLVCSQCGQETVCNDAFASWDVSSQQFVLHSTYDDEKCLNEKCEAQNSGLWVDLD